MSEFSDWLAATMKARGLSLQAVAGPAGVARSTVMDWRKGKTRPTWENCIAIARALRVDDALVRSLAGYSDVGEDTYISEATLTPEEDQIVQAWRTASAEGRRLLLDAAAVVAGTAAASAESEPPAQLPQEEGRGRQAR